jgi:hypothetical protein
MMYSITSPTHGTSRAGSSAHSKIVRFDDAVELAPVESGTGLEAQMIAEPQGLMRLLGPCEPFSALVRTPEK